MLKHLTGRDVPCHVAGNMKRCYVFITVTIDSVHHMTRLLHRAQLLSSLDSKRMQGLNKASSSMWRVETACLLKHDQQSTKLSPTYPTHPLPAYIKYPRIMHPESCMLWTLMQVSRLHLPFTNIHGKSNYCLITTGRSMMVTNY